MSASSAVLPELERAIASSAADHAEIAVAGLAGMDELRRGSGRGQGGGDLAADMAALADPGNDDPPAHRRAQPDCRAKPVVEPVGQRFEAADFGADHPPPDRDVAGGASRSARFPLHRCRFGGDQAWLIATQRPGELRDRASL